MIASNDISEANLSITICGPIEREAHDFLGTHNGALRLRTMLPQAELILVTWVGQDLNTPDNLYNKVISLPDPGATQLQKISGQSYYINYRRLVYAAYEGAKAASRDWLWRLRSDCIVENLSIFNEYKALERGFEPSSFTFFSSPVLIPNIYTRDCRKASFVGHPSDLMHYGKTADLLQLFTCSVESRFYNQKLVSHFTFPNRQQVQGAEYVPEQMIWISFVERMAPNYSWHRIHNRVLLLSPFVVANHEKAIFSNFVLASFAALGLAFKKDFSTLHGSASCYSPKDYINYRFNASSSPLAYCIQLLSLSFSAHYVPLGKFLWRRLTSSAAHYLSQKLPKKEKLPKN
jgi:hypothetical protein